MMQLIWKYFHSFDNDYLHHSPPPTPPEGPSLKFTTRMNLLLTLSQQLAPICIINDLVVLRLACYTVMLNRGLQSSLLVNDDGKNWNSLLDISAHRGWKTVGDLPRTSF